MITAEQIQTKYWALEVLTSNNQDDVAPLSGSLTSTSIDMNPHQIQAALFALKSPISQGVILADEVGLGKTIEAGIVLSEYISRGMTSLIVVAPANLCPQWQTEMQEKFGLPVQLLDRKIYNDFRKEHINPLIFKGIIVCSYHFAIKMKQEIKDIPWDLVVFDEAHKLRNLYKGTTKFADAIYHTFVGHKKLLLTATPIQNSLMDIYSLVSMIDRNILGNEYVFMDNYLYSVRKHNELRKRLECVLHRTLRRDVLEYIKYTNREAMTVAFNPTNEEEELYHLISDYIQKGSKFAITTRFRTLIVLMIRKLMSSSTSAVRGTLEGLKDRLQDLLNNKKIDLERLFQDLHLDEEDQEWLEEDIQHPLADIKLDAQGIKDEIAYLDELINKAKSIKVDGKTDKLIGAINQGFEKMSKNNAARKVIIFTESNRTLEYLFEYLSQNGFKDKIVTFSGSNNSPLCKKVYDEFLENHPHELSGSRTTDMKKALVRAFKDDAEIMIATEAAAEGLNLQFCSLLVNYDLPWNPQRIEQRIGRVHRYGQKNDVVIINFINKKNVADVRIYEILQNKFKLFDGVFGASDEILGTLSDGVDFEKVIASIFEHCRTTAEIERAFDELQASLGDKRDAELEKTKQLVLDNLAPTLQEKLHVMKQVVDTYLERSQEIFWKLTTNIIKAHYPKLLINEGSKIFGHHEEQVFGTYSERRFGHNFSHRLDYTKRDSSLDRFMSKRERKRLRLEPEAYNPSSPFGKKVLELALEIETFIGHLVVKGSGSFKGEGRAKVTLYEALQPTSKQHMIVTFISKTGGTIKIDAQDFFDHVTGVNEVKPYGFADFIDSLHLQQIEKYTKEQKKSVEEVLKRSVEQLNRWAFDEKASIHFKIEKMKNKVTTLKRQMKQEKNFKKKMELIEEIKTAEQAVRDFDTNTFETEREIEKKANRMIGAKKRALQYKYEAKEVFNCTFEVV